MKPLSASLHAKRVRSKAACTNPAVAKSHYESLQPSHGLKAKKANAISSFAFHKTSPFKTIDKHRGLKYSNLVSRKFVPEPLKYYFASHLWKMDTYFSQISNERACRSATVINPNTETDEDDKKLFASENPRDLQILARQVKAKAAQLRKADSVSKHFYIDSKTAIIIDDTIYKGEIAEERKNGVGIAVFPDNRVFKGRWKDNAPQGKGIYQTNFGFVIAGEFDQDLNVTSADAKIYVHLCIT